MGKNRFLFVIFFALVFTFSFVFVNAVQDGLDEIQDLEKTNEQLTEGVDKIEDIQGEIADSNAGYIGEELRRILLKNPVINGFNYFFTAISPVFLVLFGEPYSLSLALFFVIILWIFFVFKFKEIFSVFLSFSLGTSFIISLGLTIALAQIGILRAIAESFVWIVFLTDAWFWSLLLFFVVIIFMVIVYKVIGQLGIFSKNKKEDFERMRERSERGVLHAFVDNLKEAFKS